MKPVSAQDPVHEICFRVSACVEHVSGLCVTVCGRCQVRDQLSLILQTIPADIRAADRSLLHHRFVRPLPSSSPAYVERLRLELHLIHFFHFEETFLQVRPAAAPCPCKAASA
jgi:hypothetical protein